MHGLAVLVPVERDDISNVDDTPDIRSALLCMSWLAAPMFFSIFRKNRGGFVVAEGVFGSPYFDSGQVTGD